MHAMAGSGSTEVGVIQQRAQALQRRARQYIILVAAQRPQRACPGQGAGRLAYIAGEFKHLNEFGLWCKVAEHVKVGIPDTQECRVVETDLEVVLHIAQQHEHVGERMGHNAISPVIEPRLVGPVHSSDQKVPQMQVVVVQAWRSGYGDQPLAPRSEGPAQGTLGRRSRSDRALSGSTIQPWVTSVAMGVST
jgi:hypothetical protein